MSDTTAMDRGLAAAKRALPINPTTGRIIPAFGKDPDSPPSPRLMLAIQKMMLAAATRGRRKRAAKEKACAHPST